MNRSKLYIAAMMLSVLTACSYKDDMTLSGLNKTDFDSVIDGKPTALYVLKNASGTEACITNYGGRWVSMMVPDKNGKMTDVLLGYDNIRQYVDNPRKNYGSIIGRYANRIAKGRFTLDGMEYTLPQNENGNCLHGGPAGFHTRIWDAKQMDEQTLQLNYLSSDGEAGFPGNLHVQVTYRLTDDNTMDIKYKATTDKPTVICLTSHGYFNLSGKDDSQVLNHNIRIDADRYAEVDSVLIPTGKINPVEGTPMVLRHSVTIGDNIDNSCPQLVYGRGYGLHWVLNAQGDIHRLAAEATSSESGIAMQVYTTEPGVLFYTGNMMDENGDKGKHGVEYPNRGALCLETEHCPDSPNHPNFPSVVLRPGETYTSETIYKFSVNK